MTLLSNDLQMNKNKSLNEKINPNFSKSQQLEIEDLENRLIHLRKHSSVENHSNEIDNCSYFQSHYLSNKFSNQYDDFVRQMQNEYKRIEEFVRQANIISNEMKQNTVYSIDVDIPVSYLKPDERTEKHLCGIAIEVQRCYTWKQMWDIEEFESRFQLIKDLYDKWIKFDNKAELLEQELKRYNPFFDEEFDKFIGVANIHLTGLLYGSKIDYTVPIINNRGETSGKLRAVLQHDSFSLIEDICKTNAFNNIHSCNNENDSKYEDTIRFSIKEINDLTQSYSNNLICRYTFINPKLDQTLKSFRYDNAKDSGVYTFNHEYEYKFPITTDFISKLSQGSISIEVWSQYEKKNQNIKDNLDEHELEIKKLGALWKDVRRHILFAIEIQELASTGEWKSCEVFHHEQIPTGGIYQLQQAQSKRLVIQLQVLHRACSFPCKLDEIRKVEIGSVTTMELNSDTQLDSYQEVELQILREEWFKSIEKRKKYYLCEIQNLCQNSDEIIDKQKQDIVLNKIHCLADEQTIAAMPAIGSGIPGAPAAWSPPVTFELHRPVIFLNLDPITMNKSTDIAGQQAFLSKENQSSMISLPLIYHNIEKYCVISQWDPTIHESDIVNKITPNDTVVYLTVKATVLMSEPVHMELVLRKQIAVKFNKTSTWWPGQTLKNVLGYKTYQRTSVVYELITNIPKQIYDIQDENLNYPTEDSIRKYIPYANSIDSILLLHKLRQDVFLEENSVKERAMSVTTNSSNTPSEIQNTNKFHSPSISRRDNQLLSVDYSSNFNERTQSFSQSNFNCSTPSLISRLLYVEEQQIQPIIQSTLRIKTEVELDDNTEPIGCETLEKKYFPPATIEPSTQQSIINNTNNDSIYSIGSRVIINTGCSIVNESGTIRFIGETKFLEGIWYGIELDKPIGKHNGSLHEVVYFQCRDKHGIFVRHDKIHPVNSS